jgi:hypothetical protein
MSDKRQCLFISQIYTLFQKTSPKHHNNFKKKYKYCCNVFGIKKIVFLKSNTKKGYSNRTSETLPLSARTLQELLKPCRSQREASKKFSKLAAVSEKPPRTSETLPLTARSLQELQKVSRREREPSKSFSNLAAHSENPSEKSEALPLSVWSHRRSPKPCRCQFEPVGEVRSLAAHSENPSEKSEALPLSV